VFKKGDGTGKPFIFPRPLVHITETFFQTPGHEEFLSHICDVAGDKGNTCFLFDRYGMIKAYEACFLDSNNKKEHKMEASAPWKTRFSAIQNVTLNLPRLGYMADGDEHALFALIAGRMELMAKAHVQKRNFIDELLAYGNEGPLAVLAMQQDGMPYLRMDHACYLMGVIGLNELVQIHKNKQLHESEEALRFGLDVISYMRDTAEKLGLKYGLNFILEQTPAESTAYRFARLDLKYYSPKAGHFVGGNIARGEVYYTNSTHLNVSAPMPAIERVRKEGRFHPFIRGGAMTHVWLGDFYISKEELARFITAVFKETENDQLVLSPEFATCKICGETVRGCTGKCQSCGSEEMEGIARITQYFSRISGWNKGKLAELRDRKRYRTIL
jgi:ribonucleoside-triphosphate reductase